jgi:hypothetical protein
MMSENQSITQSIQTHRDEEEAIAAGPESNQLAMFRSLVGIDNPPDMLGSFTKR